jgi:flagellar hook-basal body complex protein FliE
VNGPIEGVAAVQGLAAGIPATSQAAIALQPADAGFGAMVSRGIEQVNAQLLGAQTDLQALATGNVENLHQVMVRLEESRMSFQLVMQVRNRALEAYQELMRMQV